MRYYISGKRIQKEVNDSVDAPCVEFMTEAQYRQTDSGLNDEFAALRLGEKVRHCKADVFEKNIHGTLAIPEKEGCENGGIYQRFYLDDKRLLFIGETEPLCAIAEQIAAENSVNVETPAQAFFVFLDTIIKDEGEYIDNYEETLNLREDEMLANGERIPGDFEDYMQKARRELLNMNRYYEQLGDMAQILANAPGGVIDPRARRLFRFFAERADRLLDDARNLREYTSQIYDMYQARINIRQNKVMQFLTVITTIFMPLTLITGWYGMNFKNIPELGWRYGYVAVMVLSVLLIVIEYIIFKKKKWM